MSEAAGKAVSTPVIKRENVVSQTKKANFSQSANSPVNQILSLQRAVGNQAVEKLLKSGVIQAKLTIGRPGDIYEQEADRVAGQVMRMPDSGITERERNSKYAEAPNIQSVCTDCEEGVYRQKNNSELGYPELGRSYQDELRRQPIGEEGGLPLPGNYPVGSQNESRASGGFFDAIKKWLNPPPKLKGIPSAPVLGDCGELRWETRWELSEYGRGGFVIQKINWREKLRRYCDRPWTEESSKTYYEAWWIVKNGKSPSHDDAVPDTFGRKRPHEAARGTIEIDGTAQYHDNVQESDLPADMVRFNKKTNAGKLRSSLNNPNLGGNISKPIPHYIKFEWDCCDNTGKRIVRRTHVISRIP